jgi:hypothetical protein
VKCPSYVEAKSRHILKVRGMFAPESAADTESLTAPAQPALAVHSKSKFVICTPVRACTN